ncbi:MAG: hypothetical protein WC208_07780 [Gallionella sp.]|jgi:hypothetical protein
MVAVGKKYAAKLQRGWSSVRSINESQALHIRNELSQVRGLIPLLMKHRNGGQWTEDERATLLRDLRALRHLSPYLIPILMPGGVFMLPLIAYWLDRRNNQRKDNDDQKQV